MVTSASPAPRGTSFLAHAPAACRRLAALYPDDPQRGIDEAERALAKVKWFNDADVASWMVMDPLHAIAALAALSDRPHSLVGEKLAAIVPEVFGLTVPRRVTTYEHQRPEVSGSEPPMPLLDTTLRSLRCARARVEKLDPEHRALVTAVLLFADVSKGGTPEQRASWFTRLGVDGSVHNEDSAEIFADVNRRVLHKVMLSEDGRWGERAKILCAINGLLGMRLRGEVGRDVFVDFHEVLGRENDGGARLAEVWSITNHCITAAVRAGLWTPELAKAFAEEEDAILQSESSELGPAPLRERIARMRHGALFPPERLAEVDDALDRLRGARAPLEQRLSRCRVWYAEAALGALSLDASVRLLAHLAGVAAGTDGVEVSRPWHLDLLGVVPVLRDEHGAPRRYPVRLLETLLSSTPHADLATGKLGTKGEDAASSATAGDRALVSFPSSKGGEEALVVRMNLEPEAEALLTLLPIYEHKEAAAFHATLKSLCDLYDLRKDDFDRVANEASYLTTMNSGRADKSRMLDFVKPGFILEIGPGGGVVLDLLSERFEGSRIVGLDASKAVVEAHGARWGRRAPYEMIHGDAFKLLDHVGEGQVDTVVLCSVLHEIFSYVRWPDDGGSRFSWGSVEALIGNVAKALKPGGRLVVRDGVRPKSEVRTLELVDPEWRAGLALFAKSFEARPVTVEPVAGTDPPRVRLDAADLYEFLTTFTWGPASFPYEIREQRAIATRGEMTERLLGAFKAAGCDAKEIEVPEELASYLQPGYPEHIKPHVRILDEAGAREVEMSPVTGVWVIERR